MLSKQVSARIVHGGEIQDGIAALPGVCAHERVFLPVYEVGVFTAAGAEAGMEIIGDRSD